MENTTNESQHSNAVKIATYVSAIALVGTVAVKTKQFVSRKLSDRATKTPLTTDA